MHEISVRLVDFSSDLYRQTIDLRYRVLREPLGLTFDPAELAREEGHFHIAALEGDAVVGVLVLEPVDAGTIKMRQVAVAPHKQGCGIGKHLIVWTENFSRDRGFKKITLHARETVVGFYEKLGYTKAGQRFIEVTIPHWKMEKSI